MNWNLIVAAVWVQTVVIGTTIMVEENLVRGLPMWAWAAITLVSAVMAVFFYWRHLQTEKSKTGGGPDSILAPPDGQYSEEFLLKWQAERKDFLETVVIGTFIFLILPMVVALAVILG